jgi:hypothetical protein
MRFHSALEWLVSWPALLTTVVAYLGGVWLLKKSVANNAPADPRVPMIAYNAVQVCVLSSGARYCR